MRDVMVMTMTDTKKLLVFHFVFIPNSRIYPPYTTLLALLAVDIEQCPDGPVKADSAGRVLSGDSPSALPQALPQFYPLVR